MHLTMTSYFTKALLTQRSQQATTLNLINVAVQNLNRVQQTLPPIFQFVMIEIKIILVALFLFLPLEESP